MKLESISQGLKPDFCDGINVRAKARTYLRGNNSVQVELSNPWMLAIYVIAMIATTWHFAYGIWLFAAKWGITPGEKARKRFGYVCAAFGLALCLMGLASIYAVVWKYPNAPANVMPAQPAGIASPAPTSPPLNSTNPNQPGEVQ